MEGDGDSHLVNSEGRKLFCKYWYPKLADNQQPRACVFVCHGFGEHCQKYNNLAAELTENGMLVFSHDHALEVSLKRTPAEHEVGGLVALKTALDNPNLFIGVVVIGPFLEVDPTLASPFLVWLARRLANWMPQMQLKSLNPDHLCRDQNVVKNYVEDPLVWHGGVKTRFSVCLLDILNDVNARLSEVTFPLFAIHGTDDRICPSVGSQRLYDNARSTNKTLKMVPGAYHQVHNEPDGVGEECVSEIIKWIASVVTVIGK